MKALTVLLALCALGCSNKKDDTCDSYVAMEMKCGDYAEDKQDATRKVFSRDCQEALKGGSSMTNAAEIFCARKHSECTPYGLCKAQSGE